MHAKRTHLPQVGGGSRLRCLRGSLPENQYEYDDEDKDAKRDIHIILSLLMMAHPSPFADYQALSVPCDNKGFRRAWRPAAEHYARRLVHNAVWQRWSQRMASIVCAPWTRARSRVREARRGRSLRCHRAGRGLGANAVAEKGSSCLRA
jgi:hypothetical protein